MRRLKAPRVPLKEATVFHIARLRDVLAACNAERPQEELIVRILVGSGVRAAELCGLAVRGPDGLPDLMLDSLDRGWSSVCAGTPAPRARSRAGSRSHQSWPQRSSATKPDNGTMPGWRPSWSTGRTSPAWAGHRAACPPWLAQRERQQDRRSKSHGRRQSLLRPRQLEPTGSPRRNTRSQLNGFARYSSGELRSPRIRQGSWTTS